MHRMLIGICAALWAVAAWGQGAVPDHRYVVRQDTDFFGADRTALFDTTFDACVRACSADDACVAFTFNDRSNACFPKSDITDRQPYVGARSATRLPVAPDLKAAAATRARALGLPQSDIDAARTQAAGLGLRFALSGETADDLLAASRAAWQRGDRAAALRWTGAAVALTDAPDLWTRYAYIALRQTDDVSAAQRRRAVQTAVPAALNGYLRASAPGGQVSALQVLADALERNGRGRDMIGVLRLAQGLQPRDDIATALEDAIGTYGFRIVEHRVDSDATAPRICATFSEPLARGVDFDPFVRTDTQGLVVAADGRDLCVDGVRHGQRYGVTFRSGLPADSGEVLARDVSLTLYVRDRSPVVRFPGRGYVLARGAGASIPVDTVNVDQVALTLSRVSDRNLVASLRRDVFGRPLSQWQAQTFNAEIAQEIWRGTGQVQNDLNADMRTRLPLDTALAGQPPGVYVLSAREMGRDPSDVVAATQWFVLSDLGLSTWQGNDGLTASVRALGTTAAVDGAVVRLISQANAVLGEVQTDAEGFAHFEAGLTRGRGAARPAMVQVETADDFVFLPLTDPAFDLSDRGVEGRPPAPPVDLFVTTDRGAYRPGATIHLTALARDDRARAIDGLPLTVILSRPDGVEYSRVISTRAQAGGHVVALPLGAGVPRGTWRIDVRGDPGAQPLATQTVLVEDFIPDRIDVTLSATDAALDLTAPASVTVDAQYLFGAPGANLTVEGDIQVRRRTGMEAYPGVLFGRHDSAFAPQRRYVQGERTDAAGQVQLSLPWPDDIESEDTLLEAVATVRVSDSGGRPVERSLTRPIAPVGPVIGIMPTFDGVLPQGATADFEMIAVGAGDALPVQWTLNRVDTQYQWYQLFGNWNWEPITRRVRVAQGSATLGATPVQISAPTDWGDYELIVESAQAPYTASSVAFSAGWYGAADSSATPDRLSLSLDADRYGVGDSAQLRIVSPHDGTALVSVLSGRVISRQGIPVTAGENLIPLSVTDAWGTGAYVTASVLRAGPASALGPARVLGLAHAAVDPEDRALRVTIDAPSEVNGQPGTTEVAVQVAGLNRAAGFVTLAAVDVGILNLTGFTPPDPHGHYFGQRRLGVELRDIYGRLIDGQSGALGTVRAGGDAGNALSRKGPPPTEAVMATFFGPVPVGTDGIARVTVPRPNFNGTVRLMAVAWSDTGVGQATRDLIARDPVVMSAALPRFLAPGDQSRLQLEFTHAAGMAGTMPLEVVTRGLSVGDAPASIDLADKGTIRVSLPIIAGAVGDHSIDIALTTPDGTILRKSLSLGVRRNDPAIATTRRLTLAASDAFTFDDNIFATLRPGTARATLAAGPLARFDMPGLISQLDRYPYGCTEQLTSVALPLLYLPRVAQAAGLVDIDDRIATAIRRILTRQASNGGFGLWRAQSGDVWLDAYVTDFLSRAQVKGYEVPDRALRLALDNLRNRINYAPDFDRGGEDIAYALMVLARAGAASIGDLRYYADTKAEAFDTPLARAHLAAALASYGEQSRADRMFGLAQDLALQDVPDGAVWRADYGTPLRDAAGVLHLAAEAGSTRVNQSQLAAVIARAGGSYSTQEAAHVLMAAKALRSGTGAPALSVDDTPVAGPVVQMRRAGDAVSTIRNISGQRQDVTLTAIGVPLTPPEAGGYGYSITRAAYDLQGALADGPWTVGERRVIVLTITPFEAVGARLMIDDPLPAGIEIDNPNLIRSGDVAGLDWLDTTQPQHTEFRADRFLAAVDHRGDAPFRLAYVARAVSPGDFHRPAALVEDMYRTEYRAVTATGRTQVSE